MPKVSDMRCGRSMHLSAHMLWGASAFALCTGLVAAPAQAALFVQTATIAVTDFGAPSQFSFFFGVPISFAGATSIKITVAGAFGDGARDGASVTPTNPALVQADLGGGTAASAGGAASFAGAGGTAGTVQLFGLGVTNPGAPANFSVLIAQPIGPLTNRTLSQGAVAGGIVDGLSGGATAAGQFAGGNIVDFRGVNGGTTVDSYLVGPGPFSDAAPFLASGSDILECTGGNPCDQLQTATSFSLTGGGDALAMLLRHELGGDELTGPVLATYSATGTGNFDCATIVGGCTLLTTSLAFGLSGGGDGAAFVFRVEIDDGVSVPEPSTLSLLLAGLALSTFGRARRRITTT